MRQKVNIEYVEELLKAVNMVVVKPKDRMQFFSMFRVDEMAGYTAEVVRAWELYEEEQKNEIL